MHENDIRKFELFYFIKEIKLQFIIVMLSMLFHLKISPSNNFCAEKKSCKDVFSMNIHIFVIFLGSFFCSIYLVAIETISKETRKNMFISSVAYVLKE